MLVSLKKKNQTVLKAAAVDLCDFVVTCCCDAPWLKGEAILAQGHFHSNILCWLTQGEVVFCGPLVCVAPSRYRRLSCGVVFTSSTLNEFSEWSAMVSKLRRGVLGSWARSEPKECWQMRSRLMGERSGRANFKEKGRKRNKSHRAK